MAAAACVRVCVEGNIGSGKSTVLEAAARLRPGLATFPEPLGAWGDLLRMYYEDPAQWSLALQLKALLAFGEPARCEAPCCLVERSPLSCRHVFAQMLFNDNKLSQGEWELFKRYCDALAWAPDLIVYVHTPYEVCYERMRERGRAAEASVDLQYIKRLDFQYETMLRYANVRVERLDGLLPAEQLAERVAALVDEAAAAGVSPPPAPA